MRSDRVIRRGEAAVPGTCMPAALLRCGSDRCDSAEGRYGGCLCARRTEERGDEIRADYLGVVRQDIAVWEAPGRTE